MPKNIKQKHKQVIEIFMLKNFLVYKFLTQILRKLTGLR